MGLFSRGPKARSMQYPDQLAHEAANLYGTQKFRAALEQYANAIDKLHTMYVIASAASRLRQPGIHDQDILDGFNSSLGATLAVDLGADVDTQVEKTLAYLSEIAVEADTLGEGGRYRQAMEDFDRSYRLGRAG